MCSGKASVGRSSEAIQSRRRQIVWIGRKCAAERAMDGAPAFLHRSVSWRAVVAYSYLCGICGQDSALIYIVLVYLGRLYHI